MAKKRIAKMTDKERKAHRVRRQLEYAKTEKGKTSIVRREAKTARKISSVQLLVLKALKEGGYLRVWHQDVSPSGWHCELRSGDDRVLRSKMHTHTVELLQSEKKQGMLLKIKSKREGETIYVISKKGSEVLEKELKNGQ